MVGDTSGSEDSESRGPSLKWSLVLVALVGFSPAYDLYHAGTVSWTWLAVGVVSWGIATGPVAASTLGQRVGAWFRAIGVLGRVTVIVLFAVASVWMHATFDPPSVVVDSFVLGGLAGVAATAVRRASREN